MHSNLIQSNNLPTSNLLGHFGACGSSEKKGVQLSALFLFSVLPIVLTDTKVGWERRGGVAATYRCVRSKLSLTCSHSLHSQKDVVWNQF